MKATSEVARERWERDVLEPALSKAPERDVPFTTISGRVIDRLYSADDLRAFDFARDLNHPGVFPYTRGIHPSGYRGKLWTMRQFAGFGTPEETNERYKTMLRAGGTGLSVAFDLPTLWGDRTTRCRWARWGNAASASSLADMEPVVEASGLRHHDVDDVNSPASMIFAIPVVAEKQGADWNAVGRFRATSSRNSSRRRASTRRANRAAHHRRSRSVPKCRAGTRFVSGYHIRWPVGAQS